MGAARFFAHECAPREQLGTHAEVHGPAVADLVETFRERWNDQTPLERTHLRLGGITGRATREQGLPDPLPAYDASPPATGTHAVQVLRTYPAKRPPYPFAPDGERSIARMYSKVLERARSFIYVEDQYFWSEEIASLYEAALKRAPDLHIIVVVPRHPDRNGMISGPTNTSVPGGASTVSPSISKAGEYDTSERLSTKSILSNRSPDLFSFSRLKAPLGAQAKSLCSDACVTFLEV